MAILGFLLLVAGAGLTIDVVAQNTSSISVDALGQTFTLSPGWIFAAGVATGAVALLGVVLMAGGMTRARRRRAVLAESRGTTEQLQAERDQLAGELYRERAAKTTADGAVDVRDAAPTPVVPVVAAPAANVVMTEANQEVPVSSHRHRLFHRDETDEVVPASAPVAPAATTTVAPDDLS